MTLEPLQIIYTQQDLEYRYAISQFQKTFGSWDSFLKEIGEPLIHRGSIGSLREEIREYFDKILPLEPPFPLTKTIKPPEYKFGDWHIFYHWGSYANMLLEIGRIDEKTANSNISPYWTEQDYINEYVKAKTELNKIPSEEEYTTLYKKGLLRISAGSFISRYMSWGRFKILMGDLNPNTFRSVVRQPSYEIADVVSFYRDLRKSDPELIIRLEDIEQVFPAIEPRLRVRCNMGWGPFVRKYDPNPKFYRVCPICSKKFIVKIWDYNIARDVRSRFTKKYCSVKCKHKSHATGISKEDLIKNYYEIKKKLGDGKIPKFHDFNNRNLSIHCPRGYIHYWGKYSNFLTEIGEIQKDSHPVLRCTKQDVIDNYNQVIKKLGRQPQRIELWDKKISKYSISAMQYFWGSYGKFLQDQGFKAHGSVKEQTEKQYSIPELKEMTDKLQKKLGKKYIIFRDWIKEYGFYHKLNRQFGSWLKFQQAMNLIPVNKKCVVCDKTFLLRKYKQIKCEKHMQKHIHRRIMI